MMVSFIQSHYLLFGSGIVVPDTRILLQNRGACFSLESSYPNEVAGNKLPFHIIIPAFLMKNAKPLMSFGVMGGHMQAKAHVQCLVRLCNYNQSVEYMLNTPRWYLSPENTVSLEPGYDDAVKQALIDKGHTLSTSPTITFGGGQAIYCL